MWGSPGCCVHPPSPCVVVGTVHEATMCHRFWDDSQESIETGLGQRGGANTGLLEVCPHHPAPGQPPLGQLQGKHSL